MKQPDFRVLVFPAGTEIGLEIHHALRDIKNVRLYGAGSPQSNHAPYVYRDWFPVPSIFEHGWVERLNDIVEHHSITHIFPAYDDVTVELAERRDQLKAAVVTSPLRTCQIARLKSRTYEALRPVMRVPAIYARPDDVKAFPVFVKPDRGQGSQGAQLVRTREELSAVLERKSADLILEFLPGAEFTVDCFSDRERGLLFCGGRKRTRTRNGISMDSEAVDDQRFEEIAKAISSVLEFHGAWFYQVRESSDGELALLEVAPRIAGTMALHRVLGVNFPLLSLYEQARMPVSILCNERKLVIDRALVNRFKHALRFDTVYVDLDDFIILKGGVNTVAIRFIYQCLNQGKKIVLLTRHAGDLPATLARYRLTGLFDRVVHLRKDERKADYAVERSAIFLDDSYAERRAVHDARGIPTFDCSMLEMLLDDRG
jgi:hypothetical protein